VNQSQEATYLLVVGEVCMKYDSSHEVCMYDMIVHIRVCDDDDDDGYVCMI
jgi:hypothetical protein